MRTPRIDAHLHFWRPACGFDNRPIADHAFYRRDFMPHDVVADLDAARIDAAILVQTAPQVEETAWMLHQFRDEPRVAGITAWVDLDAPAVDYAPLVAQPKVVGIRAQLRRIADDAYVGRPNVLSNMAAALDAHLALTLLAEPRHYPHVSQALERLPAGPVIFNHLGMPTPATDRNTWRQALRSFIRRPQTYVQLSGLPFLFGEQWRSADARSLLDDALDIVGPSNLLFASDWPMVLRVASYADWADAVTRFVERRGLAEHESAAILGSNAMRAMPRSCLPHVPAIGGPFKVTELPA
ncbi:MAG: amidohydrolase family protein [Betaproteobacteria bacterium]